MIDWLIDRCCISAVATMAASICMTWMSDQTPGWQWPTSWWKPLFQLPRIHCYFTECYTHSTSVETRKRWWDASQPERQLLRAVDIGCAKVVQQPSDSVECRRDATKILHARFTWDTGSNARPAVQHATEQEQVVVGCVRCCKPEFLHPAVGALT